MGTVETPHFQFPFHIVNGEALVLEQDTLEEIAQSVQVLLTTGKGERIELPEFGVNDPSFTSDTPLEGFRTEILTWEPRAINQGTGSWIDGLQHQVTVDVSAEQKVG